MGSRYGVRIRKLESKVLEKQRSSYECPVCGKEKVRRTGFALWKCKACGAVFAGGSYEFSTDVGRAARKFLEQG
jgi:large subunit ribosomal protein L37Ae